MRLKSVAAAAGLTVTLLFASPGFAGPGGQGGKWKGKQGKMHGERRHEKMMKEMEALGLSDTQRDQLKSLHEAHKSEMEATRSSTRAAHDGFRDAMKDGDKSDADLTTLHEKVVEAKSGQMRLRFKHMLQIRQILTVEQRAKFRGMMRDEPEEQ